MERTPNARIVSRTRTDAHGMEILDNTAALDRMDLQDKSQNDKTPEQQFVGELCIPKTEPPDVLDQTFPMDEEALTDLNLKRILIPFATPYKLKDPVIVLERCDKIWETLRLIKNAQSEVYSEDSDTQGSRYQEEDATEDRNPSPKLTYVQYEPVLQNHNVNFKLSVKATERLYNCASCGNFYSKKRHLQAHVFKVHGTPMPVNDFEMDDVKTSEVKIAKVRPTERAKNHRRTSEDTKELKKVHEPISPAEWEAGQDQGLDGEYVKCTLCNLPIKDLRKHLSTYHRIPHSETIISQYWEPITPALLRRVAYKNECRKRDKMKASLEKCISPVNPIADREAGVISKKRRSSEPCETEPKRRHVKGKTNIVENHDTAGPQSSKADPLLEEREQPKSTEIIDNQITVSRESQSKTNSTVKDISYELNSELADGTSGNTLNGNEEVAETTCGCGRSFRTPYTLSIHKSRCNLQKYLNDIEGPTDSDKSSSVALNFTIKKHNNSYAIVGRGVCDNGIPSSADATEHLNGISRPPVMQAEVTENHLAEYSENHAFVKLEVVDEDIIVDIEDEKTNNSNDVKFNAIIPETKLETDISGKENVQDENVDTTSSESKVIKRRRRKSHKIFIDDSNLKPLKNAIKCICPCGFGCQSEEALKDHVEKDHALCFRKCGYCKMIFKSGDELNTHSCLVIKGEPFKNLLRIPCSYCNMILEVHMFDEHIASEHLVSPKNLFKCYKCVSYFLDPYKRQRHMSKEHEQRPCSFCSKTFATRIRPKHDAYHFGLGFPCHDCSLAYPTSASLKEHRDWMHNKRRKSLS